MISPRESQNVAPFLMHSKKIISGPVHDGIMGRKDDILRLNDSPVRDNFVPLHICDKGLFINLQPFRRCF